MPDANWDNAPRPRAPRAEFAPQLTLNHTGPIPLWYQIASQLAEAIEVRQLADGHRLSGARRLAPRWGVAYGTANRALQELVRRGLLAPRGREGLVVTCPLDRDGAPVHLDHRETA